MNIRVNECQSQDQTYWFTSDVINKCKLHMNLYNYMMSWMFSLLKGKQLRISMHPVYGVVYLCHKIYSPMKQFCFVGFDNIGTKKDCPWVKPCTTDWLLIHILTSNTEITHLWLLALWEDWTGSLGRYVCNLYICSPWDISPDIWVLVLQKSKIEIHFLCHN